MRKIFTFLIGTALTFSTFSQVTVYSTGQNYNDAWTGWSAPILTNTTGSVNGADIYSFSGTNGITYSIETTRMFTINTNDLDIYLNATTQNATVSVEYSEDNSTWTEIGSGTYGAGFSQQFLVIPTYVPGATSFYLKLKMSGTFGQPSSAMFNNLKIDAELLSVKPNALSLTDMNFINNQLVVKTEEVNYKVSIYDLSGKLIFQEQNLVYYNFYCLNNGIYFINFVSKVGEKKTIKVVKF